jgi:hypothetical protein
VQALEQELDELDPNSILSVAKTDYISARIDNIQYELLRVQNVFLQRVSGIGVMRLAEFQPIQQIEFGTITKAYNAVDALTFDLVKNALGKEWIEKEKFAPIGLFDNEYMITNTSYIISVPYSDSFRSRFWAALAHEVAHIAVNSNMDSNKAFEDLMVGGATGIMDILRIGNNDLLGQEIAKVQMAEIASDAIAACICPPSYLTGAYYIDMMVDRGFSIKETAEHSTHPPTDARLLCMQEVLKRNGVLNADSRFKLLSGQITKVLKHKNGILVSLESDKTLRAYNKLALDFVEDLFAMLGQLNIKSMSGDRWAAIANGDIEENKLTPIDLVCLTWIKRMNVTRGDGNLPMNAYYQKRRFETKIFEVVIKLMYEYYRETICANIQSSGIYDVCIRIN